MLFCVPGARRLPDASNDQPDAVVERYVPLSTSLPSSSARVVESSNWKAS